MYGQVQPLPGSAPQPLGGPGFAAPGYTAPPPQAGAPPQGYWHAEPALTASALGAPSEDNIRTLIAQKERELHEISEYRLRSLESAVSEKDRELAELKTRLAKIKEDFVYNLKLFEERDGELAAQDATIAGLNEAIKEREAEAAALRERLGDATTRADAEASRLADLEAYYGTQLATLQESIEAARRARDEEARRWRSEAEALRADADVRVAAVQQAADAQKNEVADAAEAAVAAMQREVRRREETAAAAVKGAEERAAALRRELEDARGAGNAAQAALEAARASAAEAAASHEARLADLQERLAAVTRERDDVAAKRQALLDAYEAKVEELLGALHGVEANFKAQREEADARVATLQAEAAASAREFAAVAESKISLLQMRLGEAEEGCRRLASEKAAAEAAAASATARAEAAEERLAAASKELEALRASNATLRAERDEATSDAAGSRDAAARAERRVAALETELNSVNQAWEKRWTSREAAATRLHEEALASLREQRDALASQLGAAISGTVPVFSSPQPPAAAAAGGANAAPQVAAGTGVASAVAPLLQQIAAMETELARTRADAARAAAEVSRLRSGGGGAPPSANTTGSSSGFTGDLGPASPLPTMPLGSPGVQRPSLQQPDAAVAAALRASHEGAASAYAAAQNFQRQVQEAAAAAQAQATAAAEAEKDALRRKCEELEAQTGRFRAVVADMRAHMETLQAQLLSAQATEQQLTLQLLESQRAAASGSVAPPAPAPAAAPAPAEGSAAHLMVLLQAVNRDRDAMAQELERTQTYVRLLQARADGTAGGAAFGASSPDAAECRMLREHLASLHEANTSLRAAFKRVEEELLVVLREGTGNRRGRAGARSGGDGKSVDEGDVDDRSLGFGGAHDVDFEGDIGASVSRRGSVLPPPPPSQRSGRGALGQTSPGASPTRGSSARVPPPATAAPPRAAGADIDRLLAEREQLLEMSNQLRGELNKLMSGRGSGSPGRHGSGPSGHAVAAAAAAAASATATQAADRLRYVESAIAALSEQNSLLAREFGRVVTGGGVGPSGSAWLDGTPGRDTAVSGSGSYVQGVPAYASAAAPMQAPGGGRGSDDGRGRHGAGPAGQQAGPGVSLAVGPQATRPQTLRQRAEAAGTGGEADSGALHAERAVLYPRPGSSAAAHRYAGAMGDSRRAAASSGGGLSSKSPGRQRAASGAPPTASPPRTAPLHHGHLSVASPPRAYGQGGGAGAGSSAGVSAAGSVDAPWGAAGDAAAAAAALARLKAKQAGIARVRNYNELA